MRGWKSRGVCHLDMPATWQVKPDSKRVLEVRQTEIMRGQTALAEMALEQQSPRFSIALKAGLQASLVTSYLLHPTRTCFRMLY